VRGLKILNGVLLSLLLFLMGAAIYITAQNVLIDGQLKEFMNREILETREVVENLGIRTKITKYYKVAALDSELFRPLFEEGRTPYLGKKGDILITNQNPFAYDRNGDGRFDVDGPFMVGSLLSIVWGGHAVLVSEDDGSKIIHAVGSEIGLVNGELVKAVRIDSNRWHNLNGKIVGVRVKGATPDDIDEAVEQAKLTLGQPFNYTLIIDRQNSKGCTDLVFQAYKKAGFTIDYDLGPASGNDLILSPNTYIYLYAYTDSSGVRHIYYS
jgi:hypothetical protein